ALVTLSYGCRVVADIQGEFAEYDTILKTELLNLIQAQAVFFGCFRILKLNIRRILEPVTVTNQNIFSVTRLVYKVGVFKFNLCNHKLCGDHKAEKIDFFHQLFIFVKYKKKPFCMNGLISF